MEEEEKKEADEKPEERTMGASRIRGLELGNLCSQLGDLKLGNLKLGVLFFESATEHTLVEPV